MTYKRHFYTDSEHSMTANLVHYRFSAPGIDPAALQLEIRKYQMLFTIRVFHYNLDPKNRVLQMLLLVPNARLSVQEAEERCACYDDMLTHGLPATETLPAIPPQPRHRKHGYLPERLCSIPDFMHDLLWAVCHRTRQYRLARASSLPEKAERTKALDAVLDTTVKVDSKYTCHALELSSLPRLFPKHVLDALRAHITSDGTAGKVSMARGNICVTRYAIGSREFVCKVEGMLLHPETKRERRRLRSISNRSMGDIAKEVQCGDRIFQEMVDVALGSPFRDALHEITESSGNFPGAASGGLAGMVALLPIAVGCWMIDGVLRWRKRKTMEETGELARMWREAMEKAEKLYS